MTRAAIARRASVAESALRAVAIGAATLLALLVALPLTALALRSSPGTLLTKLSEPVVLDAIRVSLLTTTASTIILVALGLPVAFLLSQRAFPGRRVLEVLLDLPMVLPPTVAGLGLLLAFGRAGLLGGALSAFGISLPFTVVAVVMAQVFVATPFFVSTCVAGFRGVERRYLDAAATHGATPTRAFLHVTLPLALPSVVAGAAMGWARALGEFGATITFAGALQGRTQTMPTAVYVALQSDLDAAIALAVILVVMSFGLLFTLRTLAPRVHSYTAYAERVAE